MWWSLQRRHCSIHIRGLNKKEHMVPLDLHISRNFLSLSGDNLKPNLKTDTQMLTLKFLTYSNWNYLKNGIYHFPWKKPNYHLSLPLVFSILLTMLRHLVSTTLDTNIILSHKSTVLCARIHNRNGLCISLGGEEDTEEQSERSRSAYSGRCEHSVWPPEDFVKKIIYQKYILDKMEIFKYYLQQPQEPSLFQWLNADLWPRGL